MLPSDELNRTNGASPRLPDGDVGGHRADFDSGARLESARQPPRDWEAEVRGVEATDGRRGGNGVPRLGSWDVLGYSTQRHGLRTVLDP